MDVNDDKISFVREMLACAPQTTGAQRRLSFEESDDDIGSSKKGSKDAKGWLPSAVCMLTCCGIKVCMAEVFFYVDSTSLSSCLDLPVSVFVCLPFSLVCISFSSVYIALHLKSVLSLNIVCFPV